MQDQIVNRIGIEESRPVLAILGTTIRSVVNIDTNQDGDIQLIEMLNAVQTVAVKVIRKIPNLAQFRAEASDYTESEKEELINDLAVEIGIPRIKMQVLVVRGAKLVLDIIDFVIDAGRPDADFVQAEVIA